MILIILSNKQKSTPSEFKLVVVRSLIERQGLWRERQEGERKVQAEEKDTGPDKQFSRKSPRRETHWPFQAREWHEL